MDVRATNVSVLIEDVRIEEVPIVEVVSACVPMDVRATNVPVLIEDARIEDVPIVEASKDVTEKLVAEKLVADIFVKNEFVAVRLFDKRVSVIVD